MDDPFMIETQGHCFVCLVKLEPESEGVLPYSSHPIQYLCSYLKLDLDKVFNDDDGGEGERSTRLVQVPLCEGCQPLNGSLSELHIQLQRIKGEMASHLKRLHQKMTSADETALGELFRTLIGGDNIVEKLRKETILKCSHKLTAFSPQVDLQKLTGKELTVGKRKTITRGRRTKSKLPYTVIKQKPSSTFVKTEPETVLPDWDDEEGRNCDLPEPDHSPSEDGDEVQSSKREGSKSILQNSTLIPKTAGRRKCTFCSKEFAGGSGFTYHYRKVHLQLKFKCNVCGREFSSKGDFNRHYNNLHLGLKFKCQICSKLFSMKTNLRLHQRLKQCRRGGKEKVGSSKASSTKVMSKVNQGRPKIAPKKNDQSSSLPSDSEAIEVEDHLKITQDEKVVLKEDDHGQKKNHHRAIPLPSISQALEGTPSSILNPLTGAHECRLCSNQFKSERIFQDHYRSVHLQQRFQCNFCGKIFTYRQSYTKHYRNCHKEPDCLPSEPVMDNHPPPSTEDHQDTRKELEIMESQLTILGEGWDKDMKSLLENSTLMTSEEGRRKCNDCSEEFSGAHGFASHYRRTHLQLRYKCNVCSEAFHEKGNFQRHYRNLHLGIKFKCGSCSKLFSMKCNLRTHQRTECSPEPGAGMKPKRKYQRKTRGKKATYPSSSLSLPPQVVLEPLPHQNPESSSSRVQREEVEVVVGESDTAKGRARAIPPPTILQEEGGGAVAVELCPPVEGILNPEMGRYGCRLCSKEFKTFPIFQDHHNSIHLRQRFQCPACAKIFAYRQAYNNHYRAFHVKISYKCRICGAIYLRRTQLWKHQQEANCGEPLGHQCQHCGKGFSTGIYLRKHIKRVHGTQRHVCDRCGKEFQSAPYLQKHIKKMHGERKPLECPHCGRQLASQENLRLHMRIHTGERPFLCEICGKGFSAGSNRNAHQRSCSREGGQQQAGNNFITRTYHD